MAATHQSEPDLVDVEVGLRLRAVRKERGMSQARLGEHIGVTFQQVQKYERGTNRLSASMLHRAARALGVQPSDLLPRTDAAPLPPSGAIVAQVRGAEEVLTGYAAIQSPRHRKIVLDLIRSLAEPVTKE